MDRRINNRYEEFPEIFISSSGNGNFPKTRKIVSKDLKSEMTNEKTKKKTGEWKSEGREARLVSPSDITRTKRDDIFRGIRSSVGQTRTH